MLITVGITTFVWVIVTFLTKPVDKKHLVKFYRKIKPEGLWKPIKAEMEGVEAKTRIFSSIINWILGTILVYSALFGIGKIILLETKEGVLFLFIFVISTFILYKNISKKGI